MPAHLAWRASVLTSSTAASDPLRGSCRRTGSVSVSVSVRLLAVLGRDQNREVVRRATGQGLHTFDFQSQGRGEVEVALEDLVPGVGPAVAKRKFVAGVLHLRRQ